MASDNDRIRLRLRCRGAVQGVGFRPTVHRLATAADLDGWVANDPEGATAEIEGPAAKVRELAERLPDSLPPLARLDSIEIDEIPVCGDSGFMIRDSDLGRRAGALVPPDASLCRDCRQEMEDPDDRRFHYPFTTCTNCGPRFSLVHTLPYDRRRTAMACFPLCDECQAEYTDPSDRRFHAEPVCCPACGPRLWLADRQGETVAEGETAIIQARQALLAGKVVAVKGLGGFQLACRADQKQPVALLRQRKGRPSKPFAVMVRDLEVADLVVELSDEDRQLLSSPRAPVILAPARQPRLVADGVAPGLEDIGLLLPTAPLHVELLRDPAMPPLIMTSGNLSEEPICRGNREAVTRLGALADLLLLHDRDVVRRVDDSVVRSTSCGPVLVRRARGWVPEPLALPEVTPVPILAVGGHLQVTACLALEQQAFLSQHVGDLDSEPARAFHREVIDSLEEFLEVSATCIAADLHPDYPSTWLAQDLAAARDAGLVQIQHHTAHAAAVLAEHGRFPEPGEQALAISLDGTGWGTDGTAWGGEWLQLGGDLSWQRLAHLQPLPLVGGELAVREPWRVAAAGLVAAGAADLVTSLPLAEQVDPQRLRQVADLAASGSWPLASGAGRLFEAAGALLGLAAVNRWEGEAAAQCEACASRAGAAEVWPEVVLAEARPPVLPSASLLATAALRLRAGETPSSVAAGFHATFCHLAAQLTRLVSDGRPTTVAIGGGCMVNRLLLTGLSQELKALGYQPLLPRNVPPGDGGLAYGQAVLAAVAAARNSEI
jgi:hydrogenase maturation protein HypF